MASVSRDIRAVTQDFSSRAYNINRRLSRFVHDPVSFRSLMARTHMVICGSFALQFFDRTYYPDSDLDVFLHPDRSILDVGLYLEEEGYIFSPTSWQLAVYKDEAESICASLGVELDDMENPEEILELEYMPCVRAVFNFKRSSPGGEVQKIQLVVSRVSPLTSMFDFHSTCVMNVITYNAAYSLYPYATFERREGLRVNRGPRAQAALAKYSSRGWRILANPSPLNRFLFRSDDAHPLYSPWFFIETPRWVRDSRSWTIPFDMTGVAPPPRVPSASSQNIGWDPIAECGWTLHHLGNLIELKYRIIQSTLFRWKYTSPNDRHLNTIVSFLRSQGQLEHEKVPDGKWIDDVQDSWTWWDDVLPLFREEYMASYLLGPPLPICHEDPDESV